MADRQIRNRGSLNCFSTRPCSLPKRKGSSSCRAWSPSRRPRSKMHNPATGRPFFVPGPPNDRVVNPNQRGAATWHCRIRKPRGRFILVQPKTRSALRLLRFAVCSPSISVCANACHARFAFGLRPNLAATNAAIVVGVGSRLEKGTEAQVCATWLHREVCAPRVHDDGRESRRSASKMHNLAQQALVLGNQTGLVA